MYQHCSIALIAFNTFVECMFIVHTVFLWCVSWIHIRFSLSQHNYNQLNKVLSLHRCTKIQLQIIHL